MARLFDDGSSEYLTGAAPTDTIPCTLATWFKTDTASTQAVLSLYGSGNDHEIVILLEASRFISGYFTAGDWYSCSTTTQFSLNVWHHVAFVLASATSKTIYLDGGGAGSAADNSTPASLDTTYVGRLGNAATYYMSGAILEPVVYNVALTALEVWQLAHHDPPWRIKRANLVGSWLPWGTRVDRDFSGRGIHLSPVNTPSWAADHTKLIGISR